MDRFPRPLPHGKLKRFLPDNPNILYVTGAMDMVRDGVPLRFSRNMTVVREGSALTLINALRLDDAGLARLEEEGNVKNVVRIASRHGRDNAFYKSELGATLWELPGMPHEDVPKAHRELIPGGQMPFAGCSLFDFCTTKLPEGILHIDRAGGILVTGDSLQNYVEPDEFFSAKSCEVMAGMGFFQPANLGPIWMRENMPQRQDFIRLLELPFRHVLPGHGLPLRDTAKEDFKATVKREFKKTVGREFND